MAEIHTRSTTRQITLPLIIAFLALSTTVSCSNLNPLGFLTGGGTNVAANTQIGKTNNQTIGTTQTVAPSVSLRPNARVDNIDQSVTDTKVSTDRVESLTIIDGAAARERSELTT